MSSRRNGRNGLRSTPEKGVFRSRQPERRQVTVMFCDLVGSTALSRKMDPEDLLDVLRLFQDACTKVIDEYDGHVSRYMGDGILVLFGYPAAHENDAERAAHAALDIAKSVSALTIPYHDDLRLSVRVGIATGLVVAGDVIGEGASREEAIVGETPNLAARLQALAEPNTVFISDDTRKLLRDAFEYRSLGKRTLKGFNAPIKVWQVIGASAVETRFDAAQNSGLVSLVDRCSEIDQMYHLWTDAKSRSSRVLLLGGEAGIGKSRLAETLRDRIAAEPHINLQFQCSPYYRYTALYPFTRQLERAAGFERDDSEQARIDKLRALLDEESLPIFARLMSLRTAQAADIAELSPQRQKDLTFNTILGRLSALARQQPVLAVMEDVHWMDPTSLELLTFIIDHMDSAKVLIIVTFRPEFSPAWTDRPNVSTLILDGLDPSAGEMLAKNVLSGRGASKEMIAQVVDRTEGMPLFIEELAKSLLESGALSADADRDVGTDPRPLETIPVTLMDSLMARVDQLGDAKVIAQIGAVIGQEFTHSLLETVVLAEEPKLQSTLGRLVSSGLVLRYVSTKETRYVFKHALVRDAAYNSLLHRHREKLHAQIAECLESHFPETVANEPELLAHHCSHAGMTEQAICYWRLAGERASERSANLESVSHLTNALKLLDDLPDTLVRRELELSLLITLGPVEIAIKGSGSKEASDVYARAVALCAELPDSPLHFAAYWGQWRTSRTYLTKRERADKLSALTENLGDPGLSLQAHHCQWASLFNLGFQHDCSQHIERGLQLYESGDFRFHASIYGGHDPAVCGHGEAALSLWLLGFPEQAVTRMDRALAIAESLSHAGSTAHAMDIALMFHRYRRDASEVHTRAEQMISLSVHEEFAAHRAKGEMFRGWALGRLGDVEQGIASLENGIEALRAIGTNEDLPFFFDMLAECYAISGRANEGLRALDAAFKETENTASRYWLAELLRRKGELLFKAQSECEAEAESAFNDALTIARKQQAKSLELRTATSYAQWLKSRGDLVAAHRLLSPIYQWFKEGFDSVDLVAARTCLEKLKASSEQS